MSKKLHAKILFSCVLFWASSTQLVNAQTSQKLECSVDSHGVSHDLELTTNGNDISDFWYFSSVPTPGLATNCTISSDMAQGSPTTSATGTTYPMLDGDVLTIKKTTSGFLVDMSKMDPIKYCSGPIAKKILLQPGSKHCKLTL